jgi:hypothetical protein
VGIRMRHPEIAAYPADAFPAGYPEALDEAQAALWEGRGWERDVDPDAEVDYSKLKVGELRDLAAEQGLDVGPRALKDDLVDALDAARTQAYVDASAADAPELIQGP